MTQVILSPDAPMDRPGVGIVISSAESPVNPARGVVGYVGRSRMGPLNTPVRCTSVGAITRTFGGGPFGGDNGNTMDGAAQALLGRATAVWVVRAGTGGASSAGVIAESGAGGVAAIDVAALGAGTDGDTIGFALLGAATDPSRTLTISLGGIVRQQVRYAPGSGVNNDEAANLLAAFNQVGSDYVSLARAATATGAALAETPTTALTGGTDPTVAVGDIETALGALSGRPFEVLAVDSIDDPVQDLVVETVNVWIETGKLAMAVLAATPGGSWSGKLAAARGYNNPAIVYVANGFTSNRTIAGQTDNLVEGYEAAGREAGRHAALPLGRQLTHARVPDAVATIDEPPTDAVGEGLQAGLYLYTTAPQGAVWTEQGITSQTVFENPPPWAAATDSGWSKSRLVLTRFRLLTDIALAWSPLIETATNNQAGRDSIRKAAQNVIDTGYIPIGAVSSGTVIEHPDYPPTLDRATFLIAELVTPDGAEKLVLEARFRR